MFFPNLKNPGSILIKKYLFEILKEKYSVNEEVIEKVCKNLETKEECEVFAKFINDIFQNGYMMAIHQQRDALSKLGMKMNITDAVELNKRNNSKIFNQSEKSG